MTSKGRKFPKGLPLKLGTQAIINALNDCMEYTQKDIINLIVIDIRMSVIICFDEFGPIL